MARVTASYQNCAFIQCAGAGLVDAICGQCLESHSAPVCSSFEYRCHAHYCSELTIVSNLLWGLKFLYPAKHISLSLYDVSGGYKSIFKCCLNWDEF